jgi:hypothetical protein
MMPETKGLSLEELEQNAKQWKINHKNQILFVLDTLRCFSTHKEIGCTAERSLRLASLGLSLK